MADRPRIGHPDLPARSFLEPQRQVQPVHPGGLQTDADPPALASQVPRHGAMAFRGVGKGFERQRLIAPTRRHQQLLGTDFDASKIVLVHEGLLG